ncbi:uncharacterized protein LOC107220732 [Neodiprion lecontei]|uniref:Uncharacterized protein LOC107220732 n=1 Tax=Neodiprion lecontei TaxID=441921 RepID=A0A6J0BK15_NEOLC|nr:uncharacterized protein LOC107220732 [Neodiprion lecontei]XP_046483881.1 uncharacterized protein LOC124219798 [Neodiprion pinetum]
MTITTDTKMTMEKAKELKGDGLRVKLESNDFKLNIRGDGCQVTVAKNCGSIRIVGDGCSVKVNFNDGAIKYEGDGGRIFLGTGSNMESVSYVGNGGRIISGNRGNNRRKEKLVEADVGGGKSDGKGCALSHTDTELENTSNEKKERNGKTFSNAQEKRWERYSRQCMKNSVAKTFTTNQKIPVIVNENFVYRH